MRESQALSGLILQAKMNNSRTLRKMGGLLVHVIFCFVRRRMRFFLGRLYWASSLGLQFFPKASCIGFKVFLGGPLQLHDPAAFGMPMVWPTLS